MADRMIRPPRPAAQTSADMAVGIATLSWALAQISGKPETEVRGVAHQIALKLADAGWVISRNAP